MISARRAFEMTAANQYAKAHGQPLPYPEIERQEEAARRWHASKHANGRDKAYRRLQQEWSLQDLMDQHNNTLKGGNDE